MLDPATINRMATQIQSGSFFGYHVGQGRSAQEDIEEAHRLNPNIPLPKFMTVDEVRKESTQRSRRLFELWNKLHNILLQHEDTLRKRWVKKSLPQRKKILLTAWPNMASTHRPDYEAFKRESDDERRKGTRFRNEYF